MEKNFYAFGTMNRIQVEDDISEEKLNEMEKTALELDDLLSAFKPESEISKINGNAGIKPVTVSSCTLNLLERALYFSEISNGAFDVTIRPAVKLWSISHQDQNVPTELELEKIRELVDYRLLDIDYKTSSVFLRKKGQSIDLGGIAKGYAGDLIREKLIEAGVHSSILNFGGTILTIGEKKNREPWRVGIQNPLAKRGQSVGTVNLNNAALVTSGVNERFFIKGSVIYHHLLNPHTLKPAQSGVLSVSASGTNATDLDAITTALFVMGMEKGIALARTVGIDVIYLLNDGSMYATDGFIGNTLNFEPIDGGI